MCSFRDLASRDAEYGAQESEGGIGGIVDELGSSLSSVPGSMFNAGLASVTKLLDQAHEIIRRVFVVSRVAIDEIGTLADATSSETINAVNNASSSLVEHSAKLQNVLSLVVGSSLDSVMSELYEEQEPVKEWILTGVSENSIDIGIRGTSSFATFVKMNAEQAMNNSKIDCQKTLRGIGLESSSTI